jgi:hypothetical protein
MSTIHPSFTTHSPVLTQAALTPSATVVSSSSASRTTTALPNGAIAVEDTFVRRSVIQPHAWMQGLSGACCANTTQAVPAPQQAQAEGPAPAKKKKKKRGLKGLGKKLGKGLKKVGRGIKKVAKGALAVATLPLKLAQKTLGLVMSPLQLLTGGAQQQR